MAFLKNPSLSVLGLGHFFYFICLYVRIANRLNLLIRQNWPKHKFNEVVKSGRNYEVDC